jgi:hypothetical protein
MPKTHTKKNTRKKYKPRVTKKDYLYSAIMHLEDSFWINVITQSQEDEFLLKHGEFHSKITSYLSTINKKTNYQTIYSKILSFVSETYPIHLPPHILVFTTYLVEILKKKTPEGIKALYQSKQNERKNNLKLVSDLLSQLLLLSKKTQSEQSSLPLKKRNDTYNTNLNESHDFIHSTEKKLSDIQNEKDDLPVQTELYHDVIQFLINLPMILEQKSKISDIRHILNHLINQCQPKTLLYIVIKMGEASENLTEASQLEDYRSIVSKISQLIKQKLEMNDSQKNTWKKLLEEMTESYFDNPKTSIDTEPEDTTTPDDMEFLTDISTESSQNILIYQAILERLNFMITENTNTSEQTQSLDNACEHSFGKYNDDFLKYDQDGSKTNNTDENDHPFLIGLTLGPI